MSGQDFALFGLKLTFSFAAVILIVVYMVLPIIRALRTRPDILDSLNQFEISSGMDEELEIPTEQEGPPPRESIIEEARSDPRRAARMVSQWLKDRK